MVTGKACVNHETIVRKRPCIRRIWLSNRLKRLLGRPEMNGAAFKVAQEPLCCVALDTNPVLIETSSLLCDLSPQRCVPI
jgi:hypothetical protein